MEKTPTDQNPDKESQNKFEKSAKNDSPKNSSQNSSENLQTRLTEATKDLFYISETDAPFEAFAWRPESDAEAFSTVKSNDILRLAGNAPDATFCEQSLEDFFRFPTTEQDWQSDQEKEVVKRYVALEELLNRELRSPKVVKIGEVEIDVYIVGVDTDGNLAGVRTKAVET